MNRKPRVIGVYGSVVETSNRVVEGVLRYLDEVGEFQIRDIRSLDMFAVDINPPWKDQCQAVLVSQGKPKGTQDEEVADWILRGGVPAVSTVADWLDERVPCVTANQESLGKLAAQHLMQVECAAYMFFGFTNSTGSALRGRAFCETLSQQRYDVVEYMTKLCLIGSREDEAVCKDRTLMKLLRNLPKPLGVWALNDNFAAAIHRACMSLSLSIPEQVRILGADDLSISRQLRPMLSSIRTPSEEIGYQAMKTLHRLLDGKRGIRKRTEIGGAELVVRESTSRPADDSRKIDAALAYIRQHACAKVSVDQIADALNTPRRTLERHFRNAVGHSIGEEIRLKRLEQASYLLEQTELSISRIASMIGFEKVAGFSKFFRNLTGMSPVSYRKNRRA